MINVCVCVCFMAECSTREYVRGKQPYGATSCTCWTASSSYESPTNNSYDKQTLQHHITQLCLLYNTRTITASLLYQYIMETSAQTMIFLCRQILHLGTDSNKSLWEFIGYKWLRKCIQIHKHKLFFFLIFRQ